MQFTARRITRLRAPLTILLATGTLSFLAAVPAGAAPTAAADRPATAVPAAGATPQALAATALTELAALRDNPDYQAYRRYATTRSQIATLVGGQLGLDPALFDAAWAQADLTHQTALMAAFSQIGVPYRKMAEPGVGFDCSGLTSYAWSVAGLTIPRSSGDQIQTAARLDATTAGAGDLVYYPGHAMMYLGVEGTMVHSPYPGRNVEVDHISERRIDTVLYGDPS